MTVADNTPPSVSCPLGTTVTAGPTCAVVPDVIGGVNASDNCTPFALLTITQSPAAGTTVSAGTTTITVTVRDEAGNTRTCTTTFTVNDTTPPSITCPADLETTLPPNTSATSMVVTYPAATASDNCPGVTVASTPTSGSVFPVGTTTVTATATDAAGNTTTCTFTVTVLYNFTGFFSPVGNPPVLNVVNAGRAIPVKFSLSGNKGLDIFAAGFPASGVILCDASAPPVDVTETVTAGGSSLNYDAASDQYNYVWKTDSSWAGTCRKLVVKLNDGREHVANFKFK
ncbi:MAG TPA: PxKF domain-containing protein [Blastocatellia bacterium]|nr:PxKF domain-containing protein [Blastocatellia bacterium]